VLVLCFHGPVLKTIRVACGGARSAVGVGPDPERPSATAVAADASIATTPSIDFDTRVEGLNSPTGPRSDISVPQAGREAT
jgi:hypothetical protein